MRNLKLSVLLEAVDRITRPMKGVVKATDSVADSAARAQRRLDRIERTASGGAGFSRMEKAVRRANRALHDQEYRLRILSRLQSKMDANERARSKLRGQMLGAAGAAAAGAPVVAAANVEDSEVRLRTVINAEDKKAAMAEARARARALARTGLVGMIEGLDIQYALNSAGLTAKAAAAGADVVAKVSKVTAGMPEQVGEVIAGTFNNFGETMEGSIEERLKRVGELLTKTQFKFQIRNFGQLGEGISYAAASAAGAKVPLDQLVTVIGSLNSAQVTGTRAGTAFAAVARNLTKAAEEFGFEIQRSANGQMDFIGTLQELEGALSVYDDIDERNQALQDIFGEEGQRGIVPLLQNLKNLRAAQDDVVEGSKGLVDASARMFTEDTKGRWQALVGSATTAADSIGRSLLPAVNAILGPIAAILNVVGDLAERFPTLTGVIFGSIAGLAMLRVALLAGRYGWLLFQVGMLGGKMGLLSMLAPIGRIGRVLFGLARGAFPVILAAVRWLGSGLMAFAARAVPIVLTAIRAIGAAMVANPIGAVITAIAIAAGLVIAYWEPIKAFFGGLWDAIVKGAEWMREKLGGVLDFVSGIIDKIGGAVGWLADKFGFGEADRKVETARAARAAVRPANLARAAVVAGTVAAAPAMAAPQAAGNQTTVHDNRTFSITVQAAPGQDAEAIARKVMELTRQAGREDLHE